MKRIWIIGNGHDLNKGLKTSYNDFRNHLKEKIENDLKEIHLTNGNVDGVKNKKKHLVYLIGIYYNLQWKHKWMRRHWKLH